MLPNRRRELALIDYEVIRMPVVPAEQRLDALRQLGLSEALIRQSAGEQLHTVLWYRCLGPPYFVYHGADIPDGPLLIPLWDCCDSVTGVWLPGGRLQFIEFSIERPTEFRVLAKSEQGLWATVFVDLYEDNGAVQRLDLVEPADIVGFQFLDELFTDYELTRDATFEQHQTFMRNAVAKIDALATGAGP